tara:strand:- start:121 stop:714 length:594 start_codon:yes stop_codon:yes gene_type:complete
MITLEGISKSFEEDVLKDFHYKFSSGSIFKIIGKNGSGKTTLLKIIKGIYMPCSGKISFSSPLQGYDDISYIDNNMRSFIFRLKVIDNLKYFSSLNKIGRFDYIYNLFDQLNCSNLLNKNFSELSSGQMQLISIIRGLSHKPKVILLDEVFATLDESNRNKVLDFVSKYVSQSNGCLIFTSHQTDNLEYKTIDLEKC